MRLSATHLAVLLVVLSGFAAASPQPALWPQPQVATFDGSTAPLALGVQFRATGHESPLLTAAFARYAALLQPGPPAAAAAARPGALLERVDVFVATADESLGLQTNESYTVAVDAAAPSAALTAVSVFGALRALETFSQLVGWDDQALPFVYGARVADWPRFAYRSLMVDSARHFLPVPALLATLDAMAYNRMNVLHWHIVDDQSFPYASAAYPLLSGRGAYSPRHVYAAADVAAVVEYARERGIRVVPEFDTPGHTQSWGKGYPFLLTPCFDPTTGTPDGYGPLNPINGNRTFDFLAGLVRELAAVFPDQYLHLGGDEVSFRCWESNPDVQQWMRERNYTDYKEVETYYMQGLLDIAAANGRAYIVWQEVFYNKVRIRPDTVVDVWTPHTAAGYLPEVAAVTAAGYRTVVSAPWYLNHLADPYTQDWQTLYAQDIGAFNGTEAQHALLMGGEACVWGEYTDGTNLLPETWPRASAVAERLWSAAGVTNVTDAARRLHAHRCRMVRRGIPAAPVTGPGFCEPEYA